MAPEARLGSRWGAHATMFNPPWEGSQGPSCITGRLQCIDPPRFCPHPPRTCWGKLWWAHRLVSAAQTLLKSRYLAQNEAHLAHSRRFDTHRSSLVHVLSETLVGWIAPAQDRLVGASASDSGQLCDQPSPPTTSTCDDFCVFPTPMRAACAQVWLVPTSTHAPTPPKERERWQLGGWRRGTGGRVRRQQSRDSCDSVAFARPRARRALTGLQGLNVRPCPTPPGPSAGSVPGSRAA